MRGPARKGFTLVEVVIGVAILGVAITLINVGVRSLSNLFASGADMKVNHEAKIVLSLIQQDIRNCHVILDIQNDSLSLRTFDFRFGYDETSRMFSEVYKGTVTYTYIPKNATESSHILRTVNFPGDGAAIPAQASTQKYMGGNVIKDPNNNPSANYMFSVYPAGAFAPFQAVDVALRIVQNNWLKSGRTFQAKIAKRGQGQ